MLATRKRLASAGTHMHTKPKTILSRFSIEISCNGKPIPGGTSENVENYIIPLWNIDKDVVNAFILVRSPLIILFIHTYARHCHLYFRFEAFPSFWWEVCIRNKVELVDGDSEDDAKNIWMHRRDKLNRLGASTGKSKWNSMATEKLAAIDGRTFTTDTIESY